MSQYKPGQVVTYGFTKAEVIRAERIYGQDGYVVWDLASSDYGAVRPNPRWVPASSVRGAP